MVEDKAINSYPWAVPTEEQRRMFDTLSYEEQLKMVQDALTEGLKSGEAIDGETFMSKLLKE